DLADNVPNRMQEYDDLLQRTHDAGMKVIIDFVPNHVARQYISDARLPFVEDLGQNDDSTKAFDKDNNFYYLPGQTLQLHFGAKQEAFEYSEFPAKVTGNNCFNASPTQNDWYETVKLNYGVDYVNGGIPYFKETPNTWKKMLDILLFWAGKGVDGFRCDMAEMVPVEFWNWAIPKVKQAHDVIFIAEIYNPSEYRNYIYSGHFDYLYDKVGLYDTLRSVMCKQLPASAITKCWQVLEGIESNMLHFLENHDEQRIASDFFAGIPDPGIPGMIVSALKTNSPVMLYSGQEIGERGMDEEGFSGLDGRTTIFDYWSMESMRNWINDWKFDGEKLTDSQKNLRQQYVNILQIAANEQAISEGVFYDLMYANTDNPYFNPNRQYAFIRKFQNQLLLIVANFDSAEQTIKIKTPADLFLTLSIPDNRAAKVTDLLTGETGIGTLTESWPYQVTVPGYSGKIIKFVFI
ncbi:alpha-amylase, partial [Parabacteroides sp. OttesenSCG-928-G07]|nr:alpha-amylase [Parabacteroides sp. OttesenSCG-928-G07]